jgi:hypothetical protein
MHGARTVSLNSIVDAMHDANVLCSDLDPEAKKQAAARLAPLLNLSQGVPAAVGAGRQSLRRKIHAVAHSVRLQTKSWRDAVSLLNSTLTWTGDMGVESGFWTFRQDLGILFGDWVKESDAQGAEDFGVFVLRELASGSHEAKNSLKCFLCVRSRDG